MKTKGDNEQDIVMIEIDDGESVWVIDGQHRINGYEIIQSTHALRIALR